MSLFDLVCQFASDACAKAHAIDFLYMLFLAFESLKYDSNALAFVTATCDWITSKIHDSLSCDILSEIV